MTMTGRPGRKIARILSSVLSLVLFFGALSIPSYVKAAPQLIIVLDPGHGGESSGASYFGTDEKDVNLKIAEYVREGLLAYGCEVYLTREDDTDLPLSARAQYAADCGADILISLHNNASVSHKSHGASVYISTVKGNHDLLYGLADCVMGELTACGLADAGIHARPTDTGAQHGDGSFIDYYGIIRNAATHGVPTMIIEHCFMDAPEDAVFLQSDEEIKTLADADVRGIAAYYGLEKDGVVPEKHPAGRNETPPALTAVTLGETTGTPGSMVSFRVTVAEGSTVNSVYLLFSERATGNNLGLSLRVAEPIGPGEHELYAYIPSGTTPGSYALTYICITDEETDDNHYNLLGTNMVGYGCTNFTDSFYCYEQADLELSEAPEDAGTQALYEHEKKEGVRRDGNPYPVLE